MEKQHLLRVNILFGSLTAAVVYGDQFPKLVNLLHRSYWQKPIVKI